MEIIDNFLTSEEDYKWYTVDNPVTRSEIHEIIKTNLKINKLVSAKTTYRIGKVVFCKECGSSIDIGINDVLADKIANEKDEIGYHGVGHCQVTEYQGKIVGEPIEDEDEDGYEDLCGKGWNMLSFGYHNGFYYDISKGERYFSTGKMLLFKPGIPHNYLCPPNECFRKKYHRHKFITKPTS